MLKLVVENSNFLFFATFIMKQLKELFNSVKNIEMKKHIFFIFYFYFRLNINLYNNLRKCLRLDDIFTIRPKT